MSGGHFLLVLFFIDPSLAWFCHISWEKGIGGMLGRIALVGLFRRKYPIGIYRFLHPVP